jgi:hypothetical protein
MAMIKQTFREEGMSHTRMLEWEGPNSLRLKRARQVKSKVKSMLIMFFNISGIVQ